MPFSLIDPIDAPSQLHALAKVLRRLIAAQHRLPKATDTRNKKKGAIMRPSQLLTDALTRG
jgi:hypothetical protein